jgi:hypothetical protein
MPLEELKPDIIWFDTTALFTLGNAFTNADFEWLLRMRTYIPSRICTSQVNWLEYLREREQDISSKITTFQRTLSLFRQFGMDTFKPEFWCRTVQADSSKWKSYYETLAKKIKLEIIPIGKQIGLEDLVHMAMQNEAPFERKSEKGFRDAVAIFSALEYFH